MKTPGSESQIGTTLQSHGRKRRQKSVGEILKAACRRCVRDRITRVAVRRRLGA